MINVNPPLDEEGPIGRKGGAAFFLAKAENAKKVELELTP